MSNERDIVIIDRYCYDSLQNELRNLRAAHRTAKSAPEITEQDYRDAANNYAAECKRTLELEAALKDSATHCAKHTAQLTRLTDRAKAAEKSMEFWQVKGIEAEQRIRVLSDENEELEKECQAFRAMFREAQQDDAFRQNEADAELGRLLRAIPADYYLKRCSGTRPGWNYFQPEIGWNVSRFDTPEEALRAAGVKVEETCDLKDGLCRGGDCTELPDCKSLHTRKERSVEPTDFAQGFETRRHEENIEGMASDDGLKVPGGERTLTCSNCQTQMRLNWKHTCLYPDGNYRTVMPKSELAEAEASR